MTAGGDNTALCTCPENGRVADCPIARHREQWETLGRRPVAAAGGDRGDNTARWCRVCRLPCGQCGCRLGGCPPVPAADRQTDEEPVAIYARIMRQIAGNDAVLLARIDEMDARIAADADAARPAHADAVMADPITEGVTEARLREAVARRLGDAMARGWPPDDVADVVLALPEMRALLDAAAKVQRVEALARRYEGDDYWGPAVGREIRAALDGKR